MERLRKVCLVRRDDWIMRRAYGKRVLHIGCADKPYTAQKGKKGELLHQKLATIASHLVGMDLAKTELGFMRDCLGIQNLCYGDAEQLDNFENKGPYDIIIAADVVEHLNNVGRFFDTIPSLMDPETKLLITIPNTFSIKKFLLVLLLCAETTHYDHTAYFSRSNIKQILNRHRYSIEEEVRCLWDNPSSLMNVVGNLIAKVVIFITGNVHIADEIGLVIRFDRSMS